LSSLLHSWGAAGRFTLVAELLPQKHRLAANSMLGTMSESSTVVGPLVAGLLIAWTNAATVIAVDAVTFAVLAATYRFGVPRGAGPSNNRSDSEGAREAAGTTGFGIIRRDRTLFELLVLSFLFFFAFGPVMVALPIHVVDDLHASAGVLALYYAAFGIGAVLGGVITPYMRRLSLWPLTVGIVLAFGAALLPIGLGVPLSVGLASFALGGLVWAPFPATTMALFQRSITTDRLPQVLAANGAVLVVSVPLGTVLGAPAVDAFGSRTTILLCSLAMLAIGLVAVAVGRPRTPHPAPDGRPIDDVPPSDDGATRELAEAT
jgi:MFS transporter, DHA3 family, macrolide efflux protein